MIGLKVSRLLECIVISQIQRNAKADWFISVQRGMKFVTETLNPFGRPIFKLATPRIVIGSFKLSYTIAS